MAMTYNREQKVFSIHYSFPDKGAQVSLMFSLYHVKDFLDFLNKLPADIQKGIEGVRKEEIKRLTDELNQLSGTLVNSPPSA